MLDSKSITELRGIAQAMGIPLAFSDTKESLIQRIEKKTGAIDSKASPAPIAVNVTYSQGDFTTQDPILLTKKPSALLAQSTLTALLADAISRGMVVTFPTLDTWHIRWANREDSGSLRQKPRPIIDAANRLMGAVK